MVRVRLGVLMSPVRPALRHDCCRTQILTAATMSHSKSVILKLLLIYSGSAEARGHDDSSGLDQPTCASTAREA